MVILLFIALILAWPTTGLSIVVYIFLLVIRGYLQAKTRMHHADKLRAQREVDSGSTRLPSWMADQDEYEVFIYSVQSAAEHRGVPKLFSSIIMNKPETMRSLMYLAGSMEAQGASFIEQQMGVMEKLIDIHNFEYPALASINKEITSVKKDRAGSATLKWIHSLWNWADEHNIEKNNIPRTQNELLSLKHLSFKSINYFGREQFSLLPKEIGNLSSLIFLELGSASHPEIFLNNLIELPKEIGNLTKLTCLYLQFNSLTELPPEIGNLTKLKELKLGGNNISYLPKEIGKLNELEILTAWGNDLKEIPREIGLLTKLKGLHIQGSFSELPDEIINLTGLKAFYHEGNELRLNESQKNWIAMLKNNGCDVSIRCDVSTDVSIIEIEWDLFDDDIPF